MWWLLDNGTLNFPAFPQFLLSQLLHSNGMIIRWPSWAELTQPKSNKIKNRKQHISLQLRYSLFTSICTHIINVWMDRDRLQSSVCKVLVPICSAPISVHISSCFWSQSIPNHLHSILYVVCIINNYNLIILPFFIVIYSWHQIK